MCCWVIIVVSLSPYAIRNHVIFDIPLLFIKMSHCIFLKQRRFGDFVVGVLVAVAAVVVVFVSTIVFVLRSLEKPIHTVLYINAAKLTLDSDCI